MYQFIFIPAFSFVGVHIKFLFIHRADIHFCDGRNKAFDTNNNANVFDSFGGAQNSSSDTNSQTLVTNPSTVSKRAKNYEVVLNRKK